MLPPKHLADQFRIAGGKRETCVRWIDRPGGDSSTRQSSRKASVRESSGRFLIKRDLEHAAGAGFVAGAEGAVKHAPPDHRGAGLVGGVFEQRADLRADFHDVLIVDRADRLVGHGLVGVG